jgi:4a-hydroxytetrahydrobiopterin dehydratase
MVDGALATCIAEELSAWAVVGEELVGRWRFPDFAAALAAAVHVGAIAQRADHHPELRLGWGFLEVRLTTHSAGALTARDVDLAAAVQAALGTPRTPDPGRVQTTA